jgi:hypothetical protein
LGAESHVCAIYPDDIPELFQEPTLAHRIYWRGLGNHTFTVTFATWPFSGPSAPIQVPAGGRSSIYYIDSSSTSGNIVYSITYDGGQLCQSWIPNSGAMGIHITK